MKKLLVLAGALILTFTLSACGYNPVPRDESRVISGSDFKIIGEDDDDIAILEDRKTGCKYLVLGKDKWAKGMANYLDENGKPVGCKGVE